jgi:hypothetical protein
MLLRTVGGRYAGQVRDYDLPAALAALKVGTAVRVTAEPPPIVTPAPVLHTRAAGGSSIAVATGRRRARAGGSATE